jgi:hypothetical protein
MDYAPKDFIEKIGDAVGAAEIEIRGDLEDFKKFLEERTRETGAWRGAVPQH